MHLLVTECTAPNLNLLGRREARSLWQTTSL